MDQIIPGLLDTLKTNRCAVLLGPTGSGKTTRVPPALIPPCAPDRVLVLSPRRVAARAAARRVAAEQGWTLGKEVGYVTRQGSLVSRGTRLVYMTEGVLLGRLRQDPLLEGVGAVVLDEVHERHLETDLALGLLREVREARPDLYLLAMSATLDPRALAAFLGDAGVLETAGRLFDVKLSYLPAQDRRPLTAQVSNAVRRALGATGDDGGHLLVFLPGIAEIRAASAALSSTAEARGLELCPLHGSLPDEVQDRAFARGGRRKVILATNVAETSITLPGVTTVVDSGWEKRLEQDRRTGLDRLVLRRISRDSATQRAGRAGRTAPGRAYRLWTESEQEALLEREVPEILRVDLSGAVLLLRSFGCPDPKTFRWFEAPPGAAILRAEALLELLGALDGRGLTPLGRRLAALPLHPRLGRMLLEAHDTGCLREGAELAALLDGREVLSGEQDGGMTAKEDGAHGHGSDLLYRRELVFGPTGRTDPDDDLDPGAARAGAASSIRDQAEHLLGQARSVLGPEPAGAPASDEALLGIMLAGFADRVAAQRAGKQDEYKLVGGRGAKLHPGSGAMGARLILVHRLDDDPSRPLAFIRQASALPESLLDERGGIFAEEHLEWDDAEGRVVAEQTRRWGDLVLSKRAAPVRDRAEAGELLARMAAKDPRRALAPPPGVERLLARITLLAKALPEEGLPESAEELLADAAAKLCPGLLSFGELRRMDLAQAILGKLGPRGRRLIAEEAPETIGVPSGRKLPIRYVQGEAPVLPVKLQELFGLAEGPRIARGRVGLALHLLSPAGRPVQITEDLASFWKVGYQAVRRELRGRYPKHPWPEDPCSALATARVTPRRR